MAAAMAAIVAVVAVAGTNDFVVAVPVIGVEALKLAVGISIAVCIIAVMQEGDRQPCHGGWRRSFRGGHDLDCPTH